jgi:hypothetical protein
MAEWWSIEVMHSEVSAFRRQEQHDSALIEAALTNGATDGSWHADEWGVVFEVQFGTEEQWEAFRNLPVVRAAARQPGRQARLNAEISNRPQPQPGSSRSRNIEASDDRGPTRGAPGC